jgi:hypothetical protein
MTIDAKQYKAFCVMAEFMGLHKQAGLSSAEEYVNTLCSIQEKAEAEGENLILFPVQERHDQQLTFALEN